MFFLPTASTKNVIINYTKKHTISLKLLFKEIKYVCSSILLQLPHMIPLLATTHS